MELNIQNTKLELIQWISTLEDSSLLEKLQELRQTDNKDWWNDISELEKESIQKGISDAKIGNVTPHSEARKIYEKWI